MEGVSSVRCFVTVFSDTKRSSGQKSLRQERDKNMLLIERLVIDANIQVMTGCKYKKSVFLNK